MRKCAKDTSQSSRTYMFTYMHSQHHMTDICALINHSYIKDLKLSLRSEKWQCEWKDILIIIKRIYTALFQRFVQNAFHKYID